MNEDHVGGLVPDYVPEWLQKKVRDNLGRDLKHHDALNEFFKETQAVRADRFDTKMYQGTRGEITELKDLAISRFVDDPAFMDLIQDVYLALYKPRPETRHKSEMRPSHKLNWLTFGKANETREWPELRTYTTLDKWAAAMATVEFGEKIAAMYDELKELEEQRRSVEGISGDGFDGDDINAIVAALEDATEGDDIRSLVEQLEETLQDATEWLDQVNDINDSYLGMITAAVNEGLKESLASARNINDMLESFGGGPGELRRLDATLRLQLAERIRRNATLKRLAELVGRAIHIATGEQSRKVVKARDEIFTITLGNDLPRVLPNELALLDDPDTEIVFLHKYITKQLMQYEMKGTEKVGKGSIICMIDSSGSMGVVKDAWAKAVAIALHTVASAQNRDFYGIIFSGSYDPLIEFHFPPKGTPTRTIKGRVTEYGTTIEAMIEFAECGYSGGTDFETPLNRGMEILNDQATRGKLKGDLVLITDGHCAVSDKWRQRFNATRDSTGFRLFSCLIGAHSPTLQGISNHIYRITDLAGHADTKEIFSLV